MQEQASVEGTHQSSSSLVVLHEDLQKEGICYVGRWFVNSWLTLCTNGLMNALPSGSAATIQIFYVFTNMAVNSKISWAIH